MEGKGGPGPKEQVKHQMFLGNESFNTEKIQFIEKPETLRSIQST